MEVFCKTLNKLPDGMKSIRMQRFGFKAAVSYNFDDSNSSQLSNYTTLKGLGVHFTFYMWGQKMTQGPESAWASVATDGNEFGNHTWDHRREHESAGPVLGSDVRCVGEQFSVRRNCRVDAQSTFGCEARDFKWSRSGLLSRAQK